MSPDSKQMEEQIEETLMEMESTTSPWTELFQDETPQAAAAQSAEPAAPAAQVGGQHTARQSEAEAERATHDALSTIFNGE